MESGKVLFYCEREKRSSDIREWRQNFTLDKVAVSEAGNDLYAKCGVLVHGMGFREIEVIEEFTGENGKITEYKRVWDSDGRHTICTDLDTGELKVIKFNFVED